MNKQNQQGIQLFCKERFYQVQTFPDQEAESLKPWRPMVWEKKMKMEYMMYIRNYEPINSSVSQARVLLLGPVGAGKSSFFNSVNSVFRGHVTSQAISGSSSTSLTTQFRTYSLKAGRERTRLPLVLCDTMGLAPYSEGGLNTADIVSILKGHVPDSYQFKPSSPMSPDAPGFVKSPALKNMIHCVAYVIDPCTLSTMPWHLDNQLKTIRQTVNQLGIPQLVLMTKVDEACDSVAKDIRNVYRSEDIRKKVKSLSEWFGVPISCIIPVKNYSQELELDLHCDILLLSAVVQMLRFTDNYLEDFCERGRTV